MPRNTRPGSKTVDPTGSIAFKRYELYIHAAVRSFNHTTGIDKDELYGAAREIYARALKCYKPQSGKPFGCLLSTMLKLELINFCDQYRRQFNRNIKDTDQRMFVNIDWCSAEAGDEESFPENMAYISQEDLGFREVEFNEKLQQLSEAAQRLVKDLMGAATEPTRRNGPEDVARFAKKYLGWKLKDARKAAIEINTMLFVEG